MESIPINELFEHLDKGIQEDFFNGFFSLDLFNESTQIPKEPEVQEQGLFQERLQNLIDSQLRDIQSFAEKEGKDANEVK